MKRLILLLLLPLLAACSYEHEHEHEHYSLFTLGLPFAYIMRVNPPPTLWGNPPVGVLTKQTRVGEDMRETVEIRFNRYPRHYEVIDLNYPWLDTTPIDSHRPHKVSTITNKQTAFTSTITTGCDDPGHTGFIAFRVSWDTGAEVDFVYKCPEED